jgi:hypothetical protein
MELDFKAAYGITDRAGLFKVILEFYIPRERRCLVQLSFRTVRYGVKTFGGITESFEVKKGLRQGEAL